MDKTVNIVEFYDRIFIEVDGSYTTDHKVPYLTFPDGDIDHFYVNATDFFNEMLGIKIIDNSTVYVSHSTSLMIYTKQEVNIKTLEKLPKDTIISSVEILDENENPMVVTRIQISIKEQ